MRQSWGILREFWGDLETVLGGICQELAGEAALSVTFAILFQELKCSPEELGLGEQGLEGPTGEELAETLEAGTAEARLLCGLQGCCLASSRFPAQTSASCLQSS